MNSKNKAFELWLRKMKTGKLTEMQKRLKEKTQEVDVLKEMLMAGKKDLKAKDITISKYKWWISQLEKINGIKHWRPRGSDNQSNWVPTG